MAIRNLLLIKPSIIKEEKKFLENKKITGGNILYGIKKWIDFHPMRKIS
jgi:hypothetical protein